MDEKRVGIALCGAELCGTTHIGVLFALEDLGIKPDVIAGTSAGALVASMYAHGYTLDEFRRLVRNFPGPFLFDYGFPLMSSLMNQARHSILRSKVPIPNGVLRGKKLFRYIKRVHRNRMVKMPLFIVATDLYTTDAIAFTNDDVAVKRGYAEQSTDLHKEIVGSCSIPGLLTPVRHRQWMLVDGGVRDHVPVSILRKVGCEKILAVDVLNLPDKWTPITMVDILQRSLRTLMDEAIESSDLTGDNVFIIHPELNGTSWFTRKPLLENIDLGYKFVMDRKREILAFLS